MLFAGPCLTTPILQMAARNCVSHSKQPTVKPYVIYSRKKMKNDCTAYKDKVVMLEMPKKSEGVGLREALGGAVAIISGKKTKVNNDFSKG